MVDSQIGSYPAPSAAPKTTPNFFILDFTKMYGKSVSEAEAILGAPALILEMGPGEDERIQYGGEVRDYVYRGVALSAQYDGDGTLRGMSMGDTLVVGHDLRDYKIPMEDWRKVLTAVGLPSSADPSHAYPRLYE